MGGVRLVPLGGLSACIRVGGVVSLLFAVMALTSAQPAGAVFGGAPISITAAPWQVELAPSSEVTCGGVIISENLVLTSAHCVMNSAFGAWVAGRTEDNVEEPSTQQVGFFFGTGTKIDPSFAESSGAPGLSADDIALVEVVPSFTFGGGSVAPIALAPASATTPDGTELKVTGFGQHAASAETKPNAKLYSLNTTLVPNTECGGQQPGLFLCAKSSAGSTCFGDSGSGLTLPGAHPTLVGLVDRVEPATGETCQASSVDAFVNVNAPAVRDFIEGKAQPNQTTVTPTSGQKEEPKGEQPAAKSSISSTATKLSFSGGSAVVKLDCSGAATCKGKLTLTAVETVKVKGKSKKKTVTLGSATFTVAGGRAGTIKIKLSPYGRAQVKSTHGHLKASLAIVGIETEPTHKRTETVTIA